MNETDNSNLPNHIAIIMDGNRRWAKKKNMPTNFGHKEGAKVLETIARHCADIGVNVLTVYAFSNENWKRSKEEVDSLMNLFEQYIHEFDEKYGKENIKIKFLGDMTRLSPELQQGVERIENNTKDNTGMLFNVALNYGGREEILNAVKAIANKVKNNEMDIKDINHEEFIQHLYTSQNSDVDLLIRTSGEMRVSNFLLWQISYTEMYFTDKYWPDFKKEDINLAIDEFKKRKRNFGGNR